MRTTEECPFQVGDRIKCIEGYDGEVPDRSVVLNAIYTVAVRQHVSRSNPTLQLAELPNQWWNWNRFIPASPLAMTPPDMELDEILLAQEMVNGV